MIHRRQWREYGEAIRFASILGLAVGLAAGAALIKPPLAGALFGAVSAVTDFAAGMAIIVAIFAPPPDWPNTITLFGSPPNSSMLLRTQRNASTRSSMPA